MKCLLFDNYDSFTYNLRHMLLELGLEVDVRRNDRIALDEVAAYDRIVLSPGPGIPSEAGLLLPLIRRYAASKPILGICLGEQILGRRSEETGGVDLLGLIDADVRALRADGLPLPHMGWNQVYPEDTPQAKLLFRGIEPGDWFYFVHSYAMPTGDYTAARCTYGETFTAAAARDNFMGVQFHPERSGRAGARLLANFLGIEP